MWCFCCYIHYPFSDAPFTLLSAIIQLPLVLFRTLWLSQWLVSQQWWHSHGTHHCQLTGMVSSLATSSPVSPSPVPSQDYTTSRAQWTLVPLWMCSLLEPLTLAECCLATVLVMVHLQARQWPRWKHVSLYLLLVFSMSVNLSFIWYIIYSLPL